MGLRVDRSDDLGLYCAAVPTATIEGNTREIEGAAMGPAADRRNAELEELAWKFLGSEFTRDIYADWPLDRYSTPISGTIKWTGLSMTAPPTTASWIA